MQLLLLSYCPMLVLSSFCCVPESVVLWHQETQARGMGQANAEHSVFFLCRWLVGLSYRVVYRRDPVPSHKHRRLNLLNDTLTHVHGEIYIDDEQLRPGKQPAHSLRDAQDHSLMRYAEASIHSCPSSGSACQQSIAVQVVALLASKELLSKAKFHWLSNTQHLLVIASMLSDGIGITMWLSNAGIAAVMYFAEQGPPVEPCI